MFNGSINLKNKSSKNKILRYCTFIAIILFSVLLGLMIAEKLYFSYVGFFNFMPKNKVVKFVNEIEDIYMYQDTFNNKDYIEQKNKLLKQKIVSKTEFKEYLNFIKEFNNESYSNFFYDNIFEGKSSYSRIKNHESEFISEIIDDKIGYILFDSFNNGTYKKVIKSIKDYNEKDIPYLILDLRENGGGSTQEAVSIADVLLPKSNILRQEFLHKTIIFHSDDECLDFNKIFVFLNEHSASCGEILPLTLYENLGSDKVILIGNSTYGKDVGQTSYSNSTFKYNGVILNHKWFIGDKSAKDLKNYLETTYDVKFDSKEKYIDFVKNYLSSSL